MTNSTLNTLNLYVLNKGIGESIIINTPCGKWGVIDCYTSSLNEPKKNPVLKVLNDNGVNKLEFVALTHPHKDHYRGMSQLLEKFYGKISEFWRFDGFTPKTLKWLKLQRMNKCDKNHNKISTNMRELDKIFYLVKRQRQQKQLDIKRLSAQQILFKSEKFQITSIAPNANVLESFEEKLKFAQKEESLEIIGSSNENRISGILRIKYGRFDSVFLGDSDNYSQKEMLNDLMKNKAELSPKFFKVSHHGSKEGFYKDLWKSFKNNSRNNTNSVITPYWTRKLPRMEVVNRLKSISKLNTPMPIKRPTKATKIEPIKNTVNYVTVNGQEIQPENDKFGLLSYKYNEFGELIEMNNELLEI